jgi:uncharacterized membrane protein
MLSLYNRLAGHGLERLTALSDGVFAFAMTVLFIDIRVPKLGPLASEHDLWLAVVALGPRFVMYLMSFLTLGIFWVGQQTQLNYVARSDRDFAWIHIVFLATIGMVPFSTALLAEYINYRTALLIYWLNIVLLGIEVVVSWTYAVRRNLLKDDAPKGLSRAIYGRVVIAQILYAFGAALCFFNTYWSIGFIVAAQLYYAFAPFQRLTHPERNA